MSTKTRRMIGIVSTLFMAALTLYFYPRLPEEILSSIRIRNGVERYEMGPKYSLWIFAGLNLLFAGMFEVLPKIDPRKRNFGKYERSYNVFCAFLHGYLAVFLAAWIYLNLHPDAFSVGTFTFIMIGSAFILAGNVLPKFKSNFHSGFKTPWALSSEENWRRTNRLAGKLMFLCGLFCVIGSLFLPFRFMYRAAFLLLMLALGIPYVMSYLWWRAEKGGRGK